MEASTAQIIGEAGGAAILATIFVWLRTGFPRRVKRHVSETLQNGDGNGFKGVMIPLMQACEDIGSVKQSIMDEKAAREKKDKEEKEEREKRQQELDQKLTEILQCQEKFKAHEQEQDQAIANLQKQLAVICTPTYPVEQQDEVSAKG